MPAISSSTDPSAAADVSPIPAATPTPKREPKRLFSLLRGERVKQFALRLKANAQWVKQFLHGGK